MTATNNISIRVAVEGGDQAKKDMTDVGDAGEKALKKINDATKPASDGLSALNIVTSEVKNVVDEFAEHAGHLGETLMHIGPSGLIAAGAIGALVFSIHSSVEAAEDFEQSQRKLGAVLQATAGSAGMSKGQLTELAEAYSHTTLFTAEQVQQSEAILLTYKKIHSDVFDQALQATLNISSLFDNDLTASARAVGRALEDPLTGLTALTRQGVALDPVMKENIKNLAEMGDTAGVQKLILDALTHSVGGQAEAQNQGLTGASNALSKSLHEVNIALGQNIESSNIIQTVIGGLAKGFQALREEIRPTTEEELKELNARMQMMQSMGTDTMLFGAAQNPLYTQMQEKKQQLQDQLAKDEQANEDAHNNEQIAIRKQHGDALLALEEQINDKIKQQTQTQRDQILEETEDFKQKIQKQILPDKSNQADIEKEIALAEQLKNIQLDKIDQQEAEAAQKLADANNKVADSLEKRVKLEGISDPKQRFIQGETDKLTPDATEDQVQKTKDMAAALYDEQKAASDAKTAEEAHSKAIQTINSELLHTKPSYDAAKDALDEWRQKLIDDLGGATEDNQKYVDMIDQIYRVKLKEIYNKSLQDSNDWEAGASRGLQKYAVEATNAAKNMESVFGSAAKKVEDALTDMVTSGQVNMQKMRDLMKSIEQDVLRTMIRQNITGPIANSLSGMMGGQGAPGGAQASPGGGMFGSLFSGLSHMFGGGAGDDEYAMEGAADGEEGGGMFGGLFSGFSSMFGGGAGEGAAAGAAEEGGAEAASSGGIMEGLGSLFAAFLHEGGTVGGTLTPSRLMPAHIFAGAPRFHDGLMPDEFPAILQKGETVLPKNSKNSGMNVTMNISTPDAQSFNDSRGQIMSKFAGEMQRYRIRNS